MREASLFTEPPARLSVRHAAPSSDGILFGFEDGSEPELAGSDPQRIK